MSTLNPTDHRVAAQDRWTYGMSMPSAEFKATVEVTTWMDGVTIATCYGENDLGIFSFGEARQVITKRPARSYEPASRTRWAVTREDGSLIGLYRTRTEAQHVVANEAINGWALPIRQRVAAAERAARPQHKINGVLGAKGAYGVTHDMDCPACQSTPFTASPRSETYWAS